MSTAQMIYPDKKVASMIAGKMKKLHPDVEWGVVDLPTGFKVQNMAEKDHHWTQAPSETHGSATGTMKSDEPSMQELPKKKTLADQLLKDPAPTKKVAEAAQLAEFTMKAATTTGAAVVVLTYNGQSPAFIECFHSGKKIWVGKSTLLAYYVDPAAKQVKLLMSIAHAKKRGFV